MTDKKIHSIDSSLACEESHQQLPVSSDSSSTSTDMVTEPSRDFGVMRYVSSLVRKPQHLMRQLRPTAYASEVGESFRPVVKPWLVNMAYALSIGYVCADTAFHTYNVHSTLKKQSLPNDQIVKQTAINFGDKAVWHTFASMVLPAVTVHSVVKYSGKTINYGLNRSSYMTTKHLASIGRYSRIGSVFMGLASIPFIIHPLDHLTDYVMDNTVRKLYGKQLVTVGEEH